MRFIVVLFVFVINGCSPIPQGGGPNPRLVLVVMDSYSIEKVVESIDYADLGLDPVIDKTNAKRRIGDSEYPQFPQYEYAFWFPDNQSEFYGVALVKWIGDSGDMAGKYFIDVYTESEECVLCEGVKKALEMSRIEYYSACEEHPRRTEYESTRCDA